MANEKNLIPNSERTPEQLREMTRKGGIASGVARREKGEQKRILARLLAETQTNTKGETATNEQIIILKTMSEAMKGNLKATKLIYELLGEMIQKQEVSFENVQKINLDVIGGDDE